jgi:hypothetical protein
MATQSVGSTRSVGGLRWLTGAVLLTGLTVPSLVVDQDEREATCTLTEAEARWIQTVLGGWEQVGTEILELQPQDLPWVVLFNKSCAWHIAPDTTILVGADPVSTGLTYSGEAVPVRAKPHGNGNAVWLPNGSIIPVGGTAFTSIYVDVAGEQEPFVALALMEVWRERFPPDAEPEFVARMVATFLGVAIHELVHTRQIKDVARRIEELRSQYTTLPERLGDRMVEERFRDEPGFREAHDAETDLLYRAASEIDQEHKRALVREALSLIRARQAEHFTGAEAIYKQLEELFLNMEGVAVWAAYKFSQLDPAYDIGIGDDLVASRARNTWAQDQGLALYLLIDELVPDWRSRTLGPELASPYGMLEAVLHD